MKWLALPLLLIACVSVPEYSTSKNVLIVNSDNTIYRYERNASEFKKILAQSGYQWTEFNLGDHNNPDLEDDLSLLIKEGKQSIIYSIGSQAYNLTRGYSKTNKILFSSVVNWQRLDIHDDIYGVSNELSSSQEMALLRYFFPNIKSIGLLYSDKFSHERIDDIKNEAIALGVQVIAKSIEDVSELDSEIRNLLPKIDLFLITPDPIILNDATSVRTIFKLAKQYRKPVSAYSDVYINQGAALTISVDAETIGRQSANLAIQVDRNTLPPNKVQYPIGSEIAVNTCALDELEIKLNKASVNSINKIVSCDQNNN